MTFNPQQWNQTTVDSNGNSEAPDPGTYEVLLHDARAFTSKAGDDYVALELKVAAGEHAGHEWTELRSFRNEGAVRATKATVTRLGLTGIDEIASLDEFDAQLKQLIGNWYTVDVVQKGEYRNTYINGQVSNTPAASDVPADTSDFEPATAPGAAALGDEDIPF
jgi:hypothetical protein